MRSAVLVPACAAVVLGAPARALAEAADVRGAAVDVKVSGSCPEAAAVSAVLAGLSAAASPDGSHSASVVDRGASYVVSIGALSKTYTDASRNCAQRARVAAAFISLALVPDEPTEASAGPPERPSVPPPPPALAPAASPSVWVRLDARGTGESALDRGLLAPGVALGAAAGRGPIGAQVACGWSSGVSVASASNGSVVLERFPCALGPRVRLTSERSSLELAASAAVLVGALRARGTGFTTDYDSVRLEVGARLAVDVLWHLPDGASRVAPLLGVQVTYDPSAYDLDASPHGVVGQTPSWWAGGSAGVSFSIP